MHTVLTLTRIAFVHIGINLAADTLVQTNEESNVMVGR